MNLLRILLASLSFTSLPALDLLAADRPNIVVIMTDHKNLLLVAIAHHSLDFPLFPWVSATWEASAIDENCGGFWRINYTLLHFEVGAEFLLGCSQW